MLIYADHLASARERSAAVMEAQRHVFDLIRARDLLAPHLTLREHPLHRVVCLNDGIERMRIEVHVSVWMVPVELLRWADALGIESVRVHRRDPDTCVWATTDDDTFGLRWEIGAGLRYSGNPARRLPGVPAPWRRHPRTNRPGNDGSMPITDLRTAMTELGYPTEEA